MNIKQLELCRGAAAFVNVLRFFFPLIVQCENVYINILGIINRKKGKNERKCLNLYHNI